MICIPIVGPTLEAATRQIAQAQPLGHLVELRLDRFDTHDIEALKELRSSITSPVIFTLRKNSQGGSFKGSEQERLELIRRLAALNPTYLDLEYDIPRSFVVEMGHVFPHIKRIISYHDFDSTPTDLESVWQKMQRMPGELYKIACAAHSTLDAMRMLILVRSHAPLLGMCMGAHGQITRILASVFGSPWSYACLSQDEIAAPGQLTADVLQSVYAIHRLTSKTTIYGLIGSPVTASLSQFTHNKAMQELGVDAVYVKMHVEPSELSAFLLLAQQIGIRGISVTMPHKEHIIPFLDETDPPAASMGAVNTLVLDSNRIKGFNTDGKGALDAIEDHLLVRGQKVVILGAGGAARAILHEALRRGAEVSIANRTFEKADRLARIYGAKACRLETLQPDYAVLINTTPDPMPIDPAAICPHAVVMDIKSSPLMPELLQHAQSKRCTLVYGYEMFINQAIAQFALWFSGEAKSLREILQHEALKQLNL